MEGGSKYAYLETIVALIMAGLLCFFLFHHNYFLWGSLIVGFIGLFIPPLAARIHKVWMLLGETIGKIVNTVLLFLVFFLLLVPLSLLKKIFKKDKSLRTGKEDSFFVLRNHTFKKDDLIDLW